MQRDCTAALWVDVSKGKLKSPVSLGEEMKNTVIRSFSFSDEDFFRRFTDQWPKCFFSQ